VLVPLAHDEWPLRFTLWDRLFAQPRAFVFATEEERELVQRRFPNHGIDGPIAGIGVEPPPDVAPSRFRAQTGIEEPFLLYVGRVDVAKGCDGLLADFARYRAAADAFPRLMLIGECHMKTDAGPQVTSLGAVDERTKWDALAACDVFVMPSQYESLSISLLEAWTQARPVLVNARARALVGQCRRAGGGLWYANADEFAVSLQFLDPDLRARLGRSGQRYVRECYKSSRVADVYASVISRVIGK